MIIAVGPEKEYVLKEVAMNIVRENLKEEGQYCTIDHCLFIGLGFFLTFIFSGCGGSSQSLNNNEPSTSSSIYQQWHTVKLAFEGPNTSEIAADNPFLNYQLRVDFKHADSKIVVRGFYAADGIAAETSAREGNIWNAYFAPDLQGEWSYEASLYKGDSIALDDDLSNSVKLEISNSIGKFSVVPSDKEGADFRANGRIEASKGYFKFVGTDKYWIKSGTNSPENLLAFGDFDDTFRILAEARDGEAAATEEVHQYLPHVGDWKDGDPVWKGDKGKGLVGAINYLASTGMNSAYFLTMNILGDGKDVWPYVVPDEFTRFDISKLAQWDVVFEHMQAKGILLHLVFQETENETMLDEGDTGPLRQLYFSEMIARFGHHLGLVWNLGEENGPAPWSPIGQNDAQRKAMASYLKSNDPYNHPVLLHTHSHDPLREDILTDIVGYKDLDGLSLQVDKRERAGQIVKTWRKKSKDAGHEWLITMDEIGEWHTAVLSDSIDPGHSTIRRFALWGTLLSGAAGVEWYFGAKYPHNDLTSEDWRQRDQLWKLTNYAREFFQEYLPYWDMSPEHGLVNSKNAFCLRKISEIYAVYVPDSQEYTIDLSNAIGKYKIEWFNLLEGGELQSGSISSIQGGGIRKIGSPPNIENVSANQDWIILIRNNDPNEASL